MPANPKRTTLLQDLAEAESKLAALKVERSTEEGRDLHAETVAEITGQPADTVTPEQRRLGMEQHAHDSIH